MLGSIFFAKTTQQVIQINVQAFIKLFAIIFSEIFDSNSNTLKGL